MSPSSENRIFSFSKRRTIGLCLMWFIVCALAIIFLFIAFYTTYSGPGGWLIQTWAVLWAAFVFIWPIRYWLHAERPVAVGESGISSYLFGRLFASIPWQDVRLIRVVHRGRRRVGGVDKFYQVIGSRREIVVSDMILNSGDLISSLLSYAEKHKITITQK